MKNNDSRLQFRKVYTKSLEIDDVGNVCLRCTLADNFTTYYLMTQTIFGQTYYLSLGPISADLGPDASLESFSLSYFKEEYSEKR